MLQIQRMAEVVKEKGVKIYSQEYSEGLDKDGKRSLSGKARKSFRAESIFWRAFELNHPFVFSPVNPLPMDLIEDLITQYEEFESPFSTFSIEVAGQNLTVAREGSSSKINIACLMVTPSTTNETAVLSNLIFVLYEAEGEFYVFCELASTAKNKDGNLTLISFPDFDPGKDWKVIPTNIFTQLIKNFTDRLNAASTVGIENVGINIHYTAKHGKRAKTSIKKVIHIAPKSARQNHRPSISGKTIEWTHRFWRRGTWVHFYKEDGTIDFTKIGKDRDGNYNIPGKTWRIESLVNSDREDLPIVNKTRVVKNDAK